MSWLDDLSSSWDDFTSNAGLSSDQSRALGTSLLGAGAGALVGGGRGALTGAGIGGILGGGGQQLGNLLGLSGSTSGLAGNTLLGALAGTGVGGGGAAGKGALLAGGLTALDPSLSSTLAEHHAPTSSALANTAGATSNMGTMPAMPAGAQPGPTNAAAAAQASNPFSSSGYQPAGGAGFYPPDQSASQASGLSSILDKKNYPLIALALAALSSQNKPKTAKQPALPAAFTQHLPQLNFNRAQTNPSSSYYTYGQAPEQNFYTNNAVPSTPSGYARGGAVTGPASPGLSNIARYMQHGQGSARSDSISAQVSPKEYVMDGETMALLGDGNPDHGADKMDQMRVNLRKQKGKALAKGKISPNAKDPMAYMKNSGT